MRTLRCGTNFFAACRTTSFIKERKMTAARITELKAAEIEELPVEKLAWVVLRDFAASGAWHRGNWMNGVSLKLG